MAAIKGENNGFWGLFQVDFCWLVLVICKEEMGEVSSEKENEEDGVLLLYVWGGVLGGRRESNRWIFGLTRIRKLIE